jgi:hypothetical protein
LGKDLTCIALCEVAKIPPGDQRIEVPVRGRNDVIVSGFLKDHEWAHTLTLEAACVVRFLLVQVANATRGIGTFGGFGGIGSRSGHDVLLNPPKKIPTVQRVIAHYASLAPA